MSIHASIHQHTPIEIARLLASVDEWMFFDSAGNFPNDVRDRHSIIAVNPVRKYHGHIQQPADQIVLKNALENAELFGWVDYDGSFLFAEFSAVAKYNHETKTWTEQGNLAPYFSQKVLTDLIIGQMIELTKHDEFINMVQEAKERIASGEIYQVNLSRAYTATCEAESLFPLYEHLRMLSPAPMALYARMQGRELISSSPETFLKLRGRHAETRPIKGTRPRFSDPEKDRRSAYELQTSTKEIAELVMITDLLRNDLGRVCQFGTVQVDAMLQLETLEQVHHLVSTVSGELAPGKNVVDLLAQCLPGGSITGAPKIKAMEIISLLEKQARKSYCGIAGYLSKNESQCNILIRTLVHEQNQLTYHVGAGIVSDSDPELEYQETLHKAAGIQNALGKYR